MILRSRSTSKRFTPGLVAILSVLALIVAACGGAAESDDAAEDESSTEESADDAAEPDEAAADADDEVEEVAADADFCTDYFDGETVTLAVGSSPGGGYDTYMRAMAPFLEEELGTTVVPDNQTGGGGIVMINSLVAGPPDGLTINIINGPGISGNVVADVEGIDFALEDLSYLGLVVTEPSVLIARADNEDLQTLDDIIEAEDLLFGATGIGSAANLNAQAFINILDLDASVAVGFDGSSELELALLAGDIDLAFGSLGSRSGSIEAGETKPLFAFWDEDIPSLAEFDIVTSPELEDSGMLSDEQADVLAGHMAFASFDRPVVTHPDVDPQVLECLRDAFRNVMENPDFEEDVNAQGLTLLYRDGPTMQQVAESLGQAPESYLDIIREAYASS